MVKPLEPVQTVGIDTITPYKNNPRDNTKAVGGGGEVTSSLRLAATDRSRQRQRDRCWSHSLLSRKATGIEDGTSG